MNPQDNPLEDGRITARDVLACALMWLGGAGVAYLFLEAIGSF